MNKIRATLSLDEIILLMTVLDWGYNGEEGNLYDEAILKMIDRLDKMQIKIITRGN